MRIVPKQIEQKYVDHFMVWLETHSTILLRLKRAKGGGTYNSIAEHLSINIRTSIVAEQLVLFHSVPIPTKVLQLAIATTRITGNLSLRNSSPYETWTLKQFDIPVFWTNGMVTGPRAQIWLDYESNRERKITLKLSMADWLANANNWFRTWENTEPYWKLEPRLMVSNDPTYTYRGLKNTPRTDRGVLRDLEEFPYDLLELIKTLGTPLLSSSLKKSFDEVSAWSSI